MLCVCISYYSYVHIRMCVRYISSAVCDSRPSALSLLLHSHFNHYALSLSLSPPSFLPLALCSFFCLSLFFSSVLLPLHLSLSFFHALTLVSLFPPLHLSFQLSSSVLSSPSPLPPPAARLQRPRRASPATTTTTMTTTMTTQGLICLSKVAAPHQEPLDPPTLLTRCPCATHATRLSHTRR